MHHLLFVLPHPVSQAGKHVEYQSYSPFPFADLDNPSLVAGKEA